MRLLLPLIIIFLVTSCTYKATYVGTFQVTKIDTLKNGMILINGKRIGRVKPLEPGKIRAGDSIPVLLTRKS